MSLLECRIALATEAAELLDHEAECLRHTMTLGPDYTVWPDDALDARADHDRMIDAARRLRNMAAEMQRDLDWMNLVTGVRQNRRATR